MVLGACSRTYANKKVQELKEELYSKFLEDLKSNNKEIEVLLYFIDEEQKWNDSEGEYFKYKIGKSLFKFDFFFINSWKQALLKYPKINNDVMHDAKPEDNFKRKANSAYEKEVDGIRCVFTKIQLSNKNKKKLLSGKYGIDIKHMFIAEKNITEVVLIKCLIIRYIGK